MSAKYKMIVEDIEDELKNGKYDSTGKLPTEEELMTKYNVSRTTIRKSIGVLVSKGFVYQVQGSGVFVRESALNEYISLENLKGLTRDFPKKNIKSKLIKLEIIESNIELSKKMKCDIGTSLYFVERVRYIDNESFAIEYSYFNKEIIPYLNKEITNKSIYSYILDDLKLNLGFVDKIIYADKLNLESAEMLGLNENDPALISENTVFLSNGKIFEVSKAIHNYKNAKLVKLANF